MTKEQAIAIHEWFVQALNGIEDTPVVTIPKNIQYQIIEVVKDGGM